MGKPLSQDQAKQHPYAHKLSKEDRKWLRDFDRAFTYGSVEYFIKLGVDPIKAKELAQEGYDRSHAYRRDLMNRGKREIFQDEDDEIANRLSTGDEAVTVPYEDIIDTKRALTKRTLHEGYGHAPNLALGARVSLAIEGHRLQGQLGTVLRQRHSEWLIQFDNGMQGYFNAQELFQIQQHQQVG